MRQEARSDLNQYGEGNFVQVLTFTTIVRRRERVSIGNVGILLLGLVLAFRRVLIRNIHKVRSIWGSVTLVLTTSGEA